MLSAEKLNLPATPSPLFLEDPEVLELWLATWAEQLVNRAAEVPLIRPLARPFPAAARNLLSAAVALLAVSACAAHHYAFMVPHTVRVQEELHTAQKPDKELKATELKIKELEKKRDALVQQEGQLR